MINFIHHHHDISLSPHAPLDTAATTTKPPTDSILRLRSTHYKKPAMESRSLQLGTSPLARVSRQSHVRCKTNMVKCGPSIVPEPCGHVARHETIRRTMWLWENSCLGCGLRGTIGIHGFYGFDHLRSSRLPVSTQSPKVRHDAYDAY